MNTTNDYLTFTVPLTIEAHRIAQQFYERHSNLQKAKQVYLNTLAVYAVNFYLRCLGIETDLEASDSWHLAMQTLANTADLWIESLGKLECRPVLPEAQVCYVPPEVGSDRIGYMAIQLNQSLTEATLLGFLPAVTMEEFPLDRLISLDSLLEHLSQLTPVQPLRNPESEYKKTSHSQLLTPHSSVKEPINLNQWLQNIFDVGWQTVEAILELPPTELAFNFRAAHPQMTNTPTTIKRGKLLTLGRRYEDRQIALFVGLTPTTSSELDISVEVYPTGGQPYLPRALQLKVLDEQGDALMQAEARNTKTIKLEFSGEPGERFGVSVALGDVSITEAFLI
ncbi:MAG TPA: hypothetical protein DDZ80_05705 [Cyanobacteria bacterium UBA8803]|nr:hypothetical protein [Cyanobacteria bacterium UBA9273]HBL58032.1 hypothetical protein [Cyanobacteria bacterium UBA8803]